MSRRVDAVEDLVAAVERAVAAGLALKLIRNVVSATIEEAALNRVAPDERN